MALSTNHLIIGCRTVRQGVLGEAGVGTQLLHSNPERVNLGDDALRAYYIPSGIWRKVIAGVIWHEVAHTHGFDHPLNSTFCRDTPDGAGRPSMNEILDQCMQDAADELIRVQFRARIPDPAAQRPFHGELDTLLKSLTSGVATNVAGIASEAVEHWLEGPDFRIHGASGGYLTYGSSCPDGGLCFTTQAAADGSVGHVWHVVPELRYPDSPYNRPGARVKVLDVSAGLCLKYVPAPVEPGSRPYRVGDCQGLDDEWWTIGPTSLDQNVLDQGLMQIHPGNDHTRCLAVDRAAQNALTIVNDCSSGDVNLRFENLTDQSQAFTIRTHNTNECLDIPDGSADPNVRLQLFACHGGPNQLWSLHAPAPFLHTRGAPRDVEYLIRSEATGLCLRATTTGVYQTACGSPCDPWSFRCAHITSRATPFAVRGYGSVFVAGYGYLLGYGNSFILKTMDDDLCLARYWSGYGLELRPCMTVEQDTNSSLRWRLYRAR